LQYVLEALATLILLAVFIPFKPDLPGIGNDASWQLAINQAVGQGLVFGEDIVYTYGPYGSILTQSYHPATAGLMFWGGLFLGCCYSLLLVSVGRATGRWWFVPVFAAICAGLMYPHELLKGPPREALVSSYPLLLALFIYRITAPSASKSVFSVRLNAVLATLFLPLGLLPIVKPSLLFISAIAGVCCVLLLLRHDQKRTAVLCAFVPLAFMALLWRLAGQPVLALPRFFVSMIPIVSGYTEAQGLVGNSMEIAVYLGACAVVLCTVALDGRGSVVRRIAAVTSCFLFLFMAFKEGFVRHDSHALTASTAIVLAALAAALALKTRTLFLSASVAVAFIASGYIAGHYITFSPRPILTNIVDTGSDALAGLPLWLGDRSVLKKQFAGALVFIANDTPIRSLQGFRRMTLNAGEKRTVEFTLAPRQISRTDSTGKRVVEPGTITISLGGKQPGFEGPLDAATTGVVTGEVKVTGDPKYID